MKENGPENKPTSPEVNRDSINAIGAMMMRIFNGKLIAGAQRDEETGAVTIPLSAHSDITVDHVIQDNSFSVYGIGIREKSPTDGELNSGKAFIMQQDDKGNWGAYLTTYKDSEFARALADDPSPLAEELGIGEAMTAVPPLTNEDIGYLARLLSSSLKRNVNEGE